jgi:hypothetical protein
MSFLVLLFIKICHVLKVFHLGQLKKYFTFVNGQKSLIKHDLWPVL